MSLTYIALVWTIKHYNERHSGTANLVKCILITPEKASIAFITAAATYFTVNTKQISLNTIRLSTGFQQIVYLSMQFLRHFSRQVIDHHKKKKKLHNQLWPKLFCFKPALKFSMFLLLPEYFRACKKHFRCLPLLLRIQYSTDLLPQCSIHSYLNCTNISSRAQSQSEHNLSLQYCDNAILFLFFKMPISSPIPLDISHSDKDASKHYLPIIQIPPEIFQPTALF